MMFESLLVIGVNSGRQFDINLSFLIETGWPLSKMSPLNKSVYLNKLGLFSGFLSSSRRFPFKRGSLGRVFNFKGAFWNFYAKLGAKFIEKVRLSYEAGTCSSPSSVIWSKKSKWVRDVPLDDVGLKDTLGSWHDCAFTLFIFARSLL